MSPFEDQEQSQYDGKPVECLLIEFGSTAWRWTSNAVAVTLPTRGTFDPTVIRSGEQSESSEAESGGVEIHVPRTNAVAQLFVGFPPGEPIFLTVYGAHLGSEADHVVLLRRWRLASARGAGSTVSLLFLPASRLSRRPFPILRWQGPCQHSLYDGGCKVDREARTDTVTVTSVDGLDLISADFATRPDNWYRLGRVIAQLDQARFVIAHVGNRVTLNAPIAGLELPATALIEAGCDGLKLTCRNKFRNRLNYLGNEYTPSRDPHRSGLL